VNWRLNVPGALGDEQVAQLLQAPGEVVSGKPGAVQVVRLQQDGQVFYRKQAPAEPVSRLLARFLRAGHWCSLPELEARTLQQLKTQGFSVIQVLAAGSAWRWGRPVAGVLLSAALEADSLEHRLQHADDSARLLMAHAYGALAGALHQAGGFDALRAKDILVDRAGQLVLLDREKPLGRPGWHARRAARSLQRAWFRNRRSGLVLDAAGMQAFWSGYAQGAGISDATLATLRRAVEAS
jgi:hypothetical protein